MTEKTWEAVDGYYEDLLIGRDPVLEETLRASAAAGLPEIAVAPNQGRFLMLLAIATGARKILEIGTLGGYSTTWLARALPEGGRLVTLEYAPKHAEVARRNIARAGLADRVEVIVGPAVESLPKLVEEGAGPFDLVFIDADKQGYPDYLDWSLRLSPQRHADRRGQRGAGRQGDGWVERGPDGPGRAPLQREARRRAAPRRGRDPDGRGQGL